MMPTGAMSDLREIARLREEVLTLRNDLNRCREGRAGLEAELKRTAAERDDLRYLLELARLKIDRLNQ